MSPPNATKTLSAVRTTMTEDRLGACIFLQVHSDYVPELAAIVDAFRWLWSPQTAFCILRQKMAGNKTMSG